jgi:hypothetical protein
MGWRKESGVWEGVGEGQGVEWREEREGGRAKKLLSEPVACAYIRVACPWLEERAAAPAGGESAHDLWHARRLREPRVANRRYVELHWTCLLVRSARD